MMMSHSLGWWVRRVVLSALGALTLVAINFAIAFRVVGYHHPILFRTSWYLLDAVTSGAAGWLAWRYHRRRRTRVRLQSDLYALSPAAFERTIADLLFDLGYRRLVLVGRAGDRGVDITGRDPKGVSIAVQCKRYAPGARVGSPDLQRFLGALTVHGVAGNGYGLFITTSEFTAPARDLAQHHGVELIDGPALGALLERVHRSTLSSALHDSRASSRRSLS